MTKIFGWSPTEMRQREDAFAAAVDRKITTLGNKAVQLFKSQRVVTAAGTPVPPVDIGEMAALTGMWKGYVSAELMPMLSDVYLESAGVIWQGIEEAFDDFTPDAVSDVFAEEYLASATNRLVGIGQHVWLKVREELLTGFSLGESTTALANRVQQAAQVSQARANVIARTEANMAANAGSFQQVLVSGLTGTKEWLDTNDERTRCTHKTAGGQTVDLLHPFTLGGPECGTGVSYLMIPGDVSAPPSEIIQCRCSVAFDLSLDDDTLVAADRQYVRDSEGRFADTPDVDLPDMKVFGKSAAGRDKWLMSDDPGVRASTMWSEHMDGMRAIQTAVKNIRAGRDPLDGVDLSNDNKMLHHLTSKKRGSKEYTRDDFSADVIRAAHWMIDEQDKAKPESEVFRGMRVEDAKQLRVGETVDLDTTSWSTDTHIADRFQGDTTGPNGEWQARESWTPVVMRLAGSRGVDVSSKNASEFAQLDMKERVLAPGKARVVSVEPYDRAKHGFYLSYSTTNPPMIVTLEPVED